jgi:hypothetical protein
MGSHLGLLALVVGIILSVAIAAMVIIVVLLQYLVGPEAYSGPDSLFRQGEVQEPVPV